ncbi:hypothetical protein ElyMa_006620900 [Elysia marginata]|uniref:Uncharacterized protein n=1 Tax=Elysia marginata TaxID=1093978 RepID=A0AAV4IE74_9GAST|nr:hypothetical protein ElyMa_006620900 [Elysia marginata]
MPTCETEPLRWKTWILPASFQQPAYMTIVFNTTDGSASLSGSARRIFALALRRSLDHWPCLLSCGSSRAVSNERNLLLALKEWAFIMNLKFLLDPTSM